MGYASLVLQGGEIESEANTRFIEECLERIAPLDLGVTLSLGEQEESVYARWKAAGAARYASAALLRRGRRGEDAGRVPQG